MAELLQTINMPLPDKLRKGNIVPLALPFPVDPQMSPFLVSGAKDPVVWVPEAPKGKLHAGIRSEQNFQAEVIDAITLMGMQAEWGNICDYSPDGVRECVAFLTEMGFDENELEFVARSTEDTTPLLPEGKTATEGAWVPDKCVVVVPRDRSFLGWVGTVMPGKIVAVVHNPSRGIAIARE